MIPADIAVYCMTDGRWYWRVTRGRKTAASISATYTEALDAMNRAIAWVLSP